MRGILVSLLLICGPGSAAVAFDGAWVTGASDRWWKESQFASFDADGKQLSLVTLATALGPRFPGSKLWSPHAASMDKDGRLWAIVVVDSPDPFKKVCDYYVACFNTDGSVARTVLLAKGRAPGVEYAIAARTADGSVWINEVTTGTLTRLAGDGRVIDSKQDAGYKGGKYLAIVPGTGELWLGGGEKSFDYTVYRLSAPGTVVASFTRRFMSPERLVACADGGAWLVAYQNLGNYNVFYHLLHLDGAGKVAWTDKSKSENKLGDVLAGAASGGVWMKRMDKYGKYHLVRMDAKGEVQANVAGYTEGERLTVTPGGAAWFLGRLDGKWGLYRLDEAGAVLKRVNAIPIKYQSMVAN